MTKPTLWPVLALLLARPLGCATEGGGPGGAPPAFSAPAPAADAGDDVPAAVGEDAADDAQLPGATPVRPEAPAVTPGSPVTSPEPPPANAVPPPANPAAPVASPEQAPAPPATAPPGGTPVPAPVPAPVEAPLASPTSPAAPVLADPGFDAFGTRNLYPSAPGARQWAARWGSDPRTLVAGQVDPLDPEFMMRGSNHTLEILGDGTARSQGDVIRMYVGDRAKVKRWRDVELTVYGMRVSEWPSATSVSGFEFETSTDLGHTSATTLNADGLPVTCDGHAYAFSFRNDGRAILQKELRHPYYTNQESRNVWGGAAFPRNRWIGMKVVVHAVDGGRAMKLELWRDVTDGASGGSWEKVLERTDAGGWSIDPAAAAACAIAPDHVITTPEPFVILRNDRVAEQWLKKVTVREIAAGR